MAGQVCIDASIALMFLLPQDLTPRVYSLWEAWVDQDTEPVTAPLFFAEVTSVLREHVYHGLLSAAEGDEAFATFMAMRVRSVSPATLQPRAWSLAKEYNRPRRLSQKWVGRP